MPRKPRFFLPQVPVHIVQRGHSRNPVFFEAQDYATYAYWLKESTQRYGVSIHAFVLMTNHVHLLVTPPEATSVSRLMQYVGRRFVPYSNYKYGKSGSIWEGRFKASLVQPDTYFFRVMRYIEMNPVRAGMVDSPAHYRWSSYCHNAGIRKISFVEPHSLYGHLGSTPMARHKAYQALFLEQLDEVTMNQISDAWVSGTPLGDDKFRRQVEAQLGGKVGQARRGRPIKSSVKGL